MEKKLQIKYNKLKKIISGYEKIVLAFSGGIDSTLVLKVSLDQLGKENVIAVIGKSKTFPKSEVTHAKKIIKEYDVNYLEITTKEMDNSNFVKNDKFRCYYCKSDLFSRIDEIRKEKNLNWTVEGSNNDDTKDYRPGLKAIKELNIKSPLINAKFSKQEVRSLAKYLKIKIWDRPSFACLSSRIPYGKSITDDKIIKIEKAEQYLKKLNINQLRVRYFEDTAKIEVLQKDFPKILKANEKIVKYFNKLGFIYITLDISGYKTGSMNKVL